MTHLSSDNRGPQLDPLPSTPSEARSVVLAHPTMPTDELAHLCGLLPQQVAGYRAAYTVKMDKMRRAQDSRDQPHLPLSSPTPSPSSTRLRSSARSPRPATHSTSSQPLPAHVQAALLRATRSLASSLTKALRATTLIASALEDLDHVSRDRE